MPHFVIPEAGGEVRQAKTEGEQDNEARSEQGMAPYAEDFDLFLGTLRFREIM